LTFAMHDTKSAALTRRVYRAGTSPRIGALIPECKESDDGNDVMVSYYNESRLRIRLIFGFPDPRLRGTSLHGRHQAVLLRAGLYRCSQAE
jgi:hypothetical protein